MMRQSSYPAPFILCFFLLFLSCSSTEEDKAAEVTDKIHTFYYGWYGSPEKDGQYAHWDHSILPHWSDTTWDHAGSFPGGDDIGANFYPELGCYSSNDPKVISQHFKWMKQAGIGVCVLSWIGKNSFTDKSVPDYLKTGQEHGIDIAFHIEPFYETIQEFRESVEYLHAQYGEHPAVFRSKGKMVYYVYDSYKLPDEEWEKVLTSKGNSSLRNTPSDAIFIGLWVKENEGEFLKRSGFDGFYTYFASEGFVYGSTTSNWSYLSDFATKNDMLFIPCVGPGYEDTRIRPWNDSNTKKREEGTYYEKMFRTSMKTSPDFIAITSFNEWHEGTQIEPAISKRIETFTYEDYGQDTTPLFYIHKTRDLIDEYLTASD